MEQTRHKISDEMNLQPFNNGVKLTRSNSINSIDSPQSISFIFKLPLQCYFYGLDHTFLRVNQDVVRINGFSSEKDALGKSLMDVVTKNSVERIIENNKVVLQSRVMQIKEESILRNDDIFLEGISIKFPWYSNDNKIIGIFGCSFVIDSLRSYAESLSLIAKTGLVKLIPQINKSQAQLHFSKREREILHLLIRGKSAREIGEILSLSRRTVEHYLEISKTKTGSTSKSELIEIVFSLFY